MQSHAWLKIRIVIAHPDGTRITQPQLRKRVKRLLDEYESAQSQPKDFFLTEPVVPKIAIWPTEE
mgnify:CR=1 FL=1